MNDRPQKMSHPSRLELESWLSGDPGPGSADLAAHLDACPDCAARVARMRAQGERFHFRNPSFAALSARRRRPSWARLLRSPMTGPRRLAAAFAVVAFAAAGAMLWIPLHGPEGGMGMSKGDLGMKGAPAFLLFDSRRNLLDRDTVAVHGGDTLQLAVTSESPIRYRVFSRAEDGTLAELMPLGEEPDTLGAASKRATLPHSLVFPAPVRPERIICVWSRHALDWTSARALLAGRRSTSYSGADSFQVVGVP